MIVIHVPIMPISFPIGFLYLPICSCYVRMVSHYVPVFPYRFPSTSYDFRMLFLLLCFFCIRGAFGTCLGYGWDSFGT